MIVDGDDIYGDGVNVAARIEALADPGAVYLARAAADEVRDKLPIRLEPRGERRVKDGCAPNRGLPRNPSEKPAANFLRLTIRGARGPGLAHALAARNGPRPGAHGD